MSTEDTNSESTQPSGFESVTAELLARVPQVIERIQNARTDENLTLPPVDRQGLMLYGALTAAMFRAEVYYLPTYPHRPWMGGKVMVNPPSYERPLRIEVMPAIQDELDDAKPCIKCYTCNWAALGSVSHRDAFVYGLGIILAGEEAVCLTAVYAGKNPDELGEQVDKNLRFKSIDNNLGELMTVEEFKESVKHGVFIDYDGHGVWANAELESNSRVLPSDLQKPEFQPPHWATHVVWFNR